MRGPLLDQALPVVVPDLVAEVAEHGAVGLAHLLADLLAKRIVGLGDVDGDQRRRCAP